jgi:hypothetical protein
MTLTAAGRPREKRDLAGLLARVNVALGPVKAAMLYGSEARGSAGARSDVDVLALVSEGPRNVSDGNLTITAYLPHHLRVLAKRGSLFVLHLCHEGVLLHDPAGTLADTLAAYQPPADPDRLTAELAVVAGGLIAATSAERSSLGSAMQSLAFYVLRSAVYDACVRRGEPQFDCALALEQLGLAHLGPLLAERRQGYAASRLDRVLSVLPSVLPECERSGKAGLAATAVAVATDWPLASDLLAGVLAGHSGRLHRTVTSPGMTGVTLSAGEGLAVVGDVHGCPERLRSALEDVVGSRRRIVLVGDYINRGSDSRKVLELLVEARHALGDRLVLLRGNHEVALLQLLATGLPATFLHHRGVTTIRSYLPEPGPNVLEDFRRTFPRDHLRLLQETAIFAEGPDVLILRETEVFGLISASGVRRGCSSASGRRRTRGRSRGTS